MRLLITVIALLACTFSQAQSGKAWNKVRSAYDRGKPYGGIRTCDRKLAGKAPHLEFLVLRAEGHNMIGEYEKALQDGHDARPVVEPALQYVPRRLNCNWGCWTGTRGTAPRPLYVSNVCWRSMATTLWLYASAVLVAPCWEIPQVPSVILTA